MTDRMNRNAAALVASSVITATLGLVFWVVAARMLPTAEVGTGTAIVTSIVLLGNLATLGLRNGLVRFMAPAGREARRFVGTSYLLCVAVAATLAVVYAAGASWWADELTVLGTDPLAGAAFAAGTAVWTVFVLQDNVLTGLRQAVWVPIENLCYSAMKLALLAGLAAAGVWALPLAWCVPALLMIVPVNVFVFRRLLPEQRSAPSAIFTRRAIARFAVGDHAADVIRMLGVEVVVLLVLALRGAEDTAYVFFAITIAASGQLVAANIVAAFVAEASAQPSRSIELARRAGRNVAILIVPAALLGALAAPFVMQVFGADYADNGTILLRLLVLDAIPFGVLALGTGWARLQRAVGTIVWIAIGTAAAPLIGVAAVPMFGLDAIGWAALLGHTALAIVVAATVLRPVWSSAVGLSGWLVERRRGLRQRRRARAVAAVLDELDATHRGSRRLEPRWLVPSDNDTAVVRVDDPEAPRIIKIALSDAAADGLHRHAAALAAFGARTEPVAGVLPEVVDSGRCLGHDYIVETACVGRAPLAADHHTLTAVARTIGQLHALTAAPQGVGNETVDDLVMRPTATLAADPRLRPLLAEIYRLRAVLRDGLTGRRLVLARTHGDCWIGNALVETNGQNVVVTGIIDWEDSRGSGLPDADLAHLWLAAQGEHIGRATLDVLRTGAGAKFHDDLGVERPNPQLPADLVVLLAWLDHVAAGLTRASRFGLGRVWLANNVKPVLRAVEGMDTCEWTNRRLPRPERTTVDAR